MATPARLPDALQAGPFTVAGARSLGVTPSRLRRGDLLVPTRGVRATTPPTDLREAAGAISLGLPAPFAFSHLTAACLLGLPLPSSATTRSPLHVMRPTDRPPTHRRGVVGHRGLELRYVLSTGGLPVVGPVDTWADLAGNLAHDELVVIADRLLAVGIARAELEGALARRSGARGVRALRPALADARAGSRSPMETRARLVFLRGGLPEPELNADVHDRAGQWLLCADFLWREQRVIAEYQGDEHGADRRRWQSDISRRRAAYDEGWNVVELTSRDLVVAPARHTLLIRIARLLGVDPASVSPGRARPANPPRSA